jgi:glycine/D-amino acid oxidase-like deaminating enzyme
MADKRAVVIGGGFFGCATAIHLARRGWRVDVLEQGAELMQRASYVNQARLHNGYHYPRSFQTAIRSRANMPQFCEVYPEAVFTEFRPLYAIARYDSKVSARGFAHFCKASGIPLQRANAEDRSLFDHRLIEEVFEAVEPAFDARALLAQALKVIPGLGVGVHLQTRVKGVTKASTPIQGLVVNTQDGGSFSAPWVFNCTYAALNHVSGRQLPPQMSLQHKISEVLLVKPPPELKGRGITLMDGDFFSIMPFPARGLHSLTHVRHTHHVSWVESSLSGQQPVNPLVILQDFLRAHPQGAAGRSRGPWMIRDAQRFVPSVKDVTVVEPLFDVKTLMTKTAVDDARPILFHRDAAMPNLISILGGKIDNIFDVLTYIDKLLPPDIRVAATQE